MLAYVTRLPAPILLAVLAAALVVMSGTTSPSREVSVLDGLRQAASGISLPITFEENRGQSGDSVAFISRGSGFQMFAAEDGAVFAVPSAEGSVSFQMQVLGGNESPAITAQHPQPGIVNYFLGDDPAGWRTGIPTYGAVTYEAVYPGIDLVLYGNERQMEYDFVVAPGVDPSVIGFTFAGADRVELTSAGELLLSLPGAEVLQRPPVVYQAVDGARRPVQGAYTVNGDVVGFTIGDYDAALPLVIDPVLVFGTYLGGGGVDHAHGVDVDADGNVYVTGFTTSTDFPVTLGAFSEDFTGTTVSDVFVTKLNPGGDTLIYSTYIGGTGADRGYDVSVDADGQAFVAGSAGGGGFPTTPGAISTGSGGFVAKLSDDGSELLYSTTLGSNTQVFGLTIDGNGLAYIAGFSLQAQFPATAGSFQPALNGNGDGIVGVLNEDGTGLVWGSYIGGVGREFAYDVARDSAGYVYVTGETPSDDFPTVNAFQGTKGVQSDAFVARIVPDGSSVVYATYLGGDGGGLSDSAFGIAADDDGNAYITGQTNSANFPVSAARLQDYGGNQDAFVTKLGPNGNMIFSTFLGGSNVERGSAIELDSNGDIHVVGRTVSADFPLVDPIQAAGGGNDAFAVKLNATGTALLYSTYIGGSDTDLAGSAGNPDGDPLALDGDGNAYVVGVTSSIDFPTSNGAFQTSNSGAEDAFVVKLLAEGNLWGDVDCDGVITTRDNQALLRNALQQNPLSQTEPCPDIGAQANIAGFGQLAWGDSDCDGAVTTRDNQALLRRILAQNALSQTPPCPELGEVIELG